MSLRIDTRPQAHLIPNIVAVTRSVLRRDARATVTIVANPAVQGALINALAVHERARINWEVA